MGHKGYYGQYTGNSKFSKKHDEAYDAKEAYNKDLTASARLHYLENDRHDHESPAKNLVGKKRAEAGLTSYPKKLDMKDNPEEAGYEKCLEKWIAKRKAAAQNALHEIITNKN